MENFIFCALFFVECQEGRAFLKKFIYISSSVIDGKYKFTYSDQYMSLFIFLFLYQLVTEPK